MNNSIESTAQNRNIISDIKDLKQNKLENLKFGMQNGDVKVAVFLLLKTCGHTNSVGLFLEKHNDEFNEYKVQFTIDLQTGLPVYPEGIIFSKHQEMYFKALSALNDYLIENPLSYDYIKRYKQAEDNYKNKYIDLVSYLNEKKMIKNYS
ncbi:hypothetical protein [Brucella gallinifaecis]|uniref:hypothetical protein n=1 Tax=Brucella gallinifaecis TaxID=215590 RepID=UPI002362AB5E|nr:hypothetical protein [Brucella gallinifaecis]